MHAFIKNIVFFFSVSVWKCVHIFGGYVYWFVGGPTDGSGEEDMSPIGSFSTANERGGLLRVVQPDGPTVQLDVDYPPSTTSAATTLWSNSSRYPLSLFCATLFNVFLVHKCFLEHNWHARHQKTLYAHRDMLCMPCNF